MSARFDKRRRLQSANDEVRGYETVTDCRKEDQERPRRPRLRVIVLDHTSGLPIEDAMVTVRERGGPYHNARATNHRGRVQFELAAGSYDISARCPGQQDQRRQRHR
jgi:hypothetical protein